eukprot:306142_1
MYHFMHKLADIKDHKQQIPHMERLTAWIHSQPPKKQHYFCQIICKSGLLLSFSDAIVNTDLISNTTESIQLIRPIVRLFRLLSQLKLCTYLLNIHLIDTLAYLIDTALYIHSLHNASSRDVLIDIIPEIAYVIG